MLHPLFHGLKLLFYFMFPVDGNTVILIFCIIYFPFLVKASWPIPSNHFNLIMLLFMSQLWRHVMRKMCVEVNVGWISLGKRKDRQSQWSWILLLYAFTILICHKINFHFQQLEKWVLIFTQNPQSIKVNHKL